MWYASKGLKIDNVHKPLGGRIEEMPTPGGKRKKLNNSTYMSDASISECTNCRRPRCSGFCDHIRMVERASVDPRKRESSKRSGGYKPKRNYTYKGKRYSSGELAEIAGISLQAFHGRIKSGWTVEEAVETPCGIKRPRKE